MTRQHAIASIVFVTGWLLCDLWFLVEATPESFQRIGSFWVAVSIAIAYQRAIRDRMSSSIPGQYTREIGDRTVELALDLRDARLRIGSIAEDVNQTRSELGLEKASNSWSLELDNQKRKSLSPVDENAFRSAREVNEFKLTVAERDYATMEKRSYNIEIIVGFVSTLQWGYGDLFHCFIGTGEWQSC